MRGNAGPTANAPDRLGGAGPEARSCGGVGGETVGVGLGVERWRPCLFCFFESRLSEKQDSEISQLSGESAV